MLKLYRKFEGIMKKKRKIVSHLIAEITVTEEVVIEQKKKLMEIIDSAKLTVKNNGKSMFELEEIIKSKFHGRLVDPEEHKVRSMKLNIAMNKDLDVSKLKEISKLENYWEDREAKAKSMIENGMVFDIAVYEFDEEDQYGNKARLEIDRIHNYMTLSYGRRELMNEIITEYGVFQEDIDDETPRFISYAYAMNSIDDN